VLFKIYYNGKYVVSNIQKPTFTYSWIELLFNTLQSVVNKTIVLDKDTDESLPQKEFEFSEQFLQDFHSHVVSIIQTENIVVENVIQNKWMQKYIFKQGSFVAEIDFYYNGKKQFSSIEPQPNRSTSIELLNRINELIQKSNITK
jgi:hypothetical protein